ncbi:MAG: hypothetical protein ABI606_10690 [Rhodoferax sp.]
MNSYRHQGQLHPKVTLDQSVKLNLATILNPSQVERALKFSPPDQQEKLRGQWLINGVASQNMCDELGENFPGYIASTLAVLPTPTGAAYAVLSTQIGSLQHRFVLPLYEPIVMEFFGAICNKRLNIFLAPEGCDDGRTYDTALSKETTNSIFDAARQLDHRRRDSFLQELPILLNSVSDPMLLPGFACEVVRCVEVSVVMPFATIKGQRVL